MISSNPRAVDRAIRRLTREVSELDRLFYGAYEKSDHFLYAGMLEHKRDDFVRGAVLQMHTAIENILTETICDKLLGVRPRQRKRRTRVMRTIRGVAAQDLLDGPRSLGFAQKVKLAVALGLITTHLSEKLNELNKLRNACSHNWLLNVRIRRNKRPKKQKPPLLAYQGRGLHGIAAFEEFIRDFGGVYLRLYARNTGTHL